MKIVSLVVFLMLVLSACGAGTPVIEETDNPKVIVTPYDGGFAKAVMPDGTVCYFTDAGGLSCDFSK